ncbi:MAG TPA: hypothetical protein VN047_00975 [Sphingopyxis sp.]|uniref:hypothetical protein n=1 Tax=Sphingopyxis sp. TaxID=1908224 RepID=UPI002C8FE777|nr:hypothetical protein [Sphingopyxis sp.]HWW55443.1 hypothetical protein [Sphingopyxis sp.]
MTTQVRAASRRKMALQALLGALAGAGGMIAAMTLLEGEALAWQPSQIILAGVGMIHVLMGLFVGVGVMAPRLLGQHLLNVADAEEIVEERRNMGSSALGCGLIGAALMLLAYATVEGAGAPVTAATAFWLLLALLVIGTAIVLPMWRRFDELWRQLTIDASAIAGNILLGLCVIWGGAAAAGIVAGPRPLDLVSAAFGILLLSTFIAVGRRGMMVPS